MAVYKSNVASLIFIFVVIRCFETGAEPSFSYDMGAVDGPQNWAKLNPSWTICGTGSQQSPIDIVQAVSEPSRADLNVQYKLAQALIKHEGHDIEVLWTGDAGGIIISGSKYKLQRCHFHFSSEHAINGIRFNMEMHIVHADSVGNIAVIGIMYKVGLLPDSFVSKLSPYLCSVNKNGSDMGSVDPRDIKFPSRSKYYRYIGSLTTPPCSENVTWTLFKTVKSISALQIKALMDAVREGNKRNARPLQPSNNRSVYLLSS